MPNQPNEVGDNELEGAYMAQTTHHRSGLSRIAAMILVWTVASSHAAGLDSAVNFDIQPQTMSTALLEFSQQAQVQVLTSTEILSDLSAPAVRGRMAPAEAMGKLLQGTKLTFHAVGGNAIAIEVGTTADATAFLPARLAQSDTPASGMSGESTRRADEEKSKGIQEIVVTAQKRQERALDVPMSITAIRGERLQEQGIRNLQDLSYYVPSLTVNESSPGFGVIAIRGLGNERGTSALTGVYLDEAAIASNTFFNVDVVPIDLERVEVLKGPQGTLYGEGSTGGTIRYITRNPDLTGFGGSVDLSLSSTEDGGFGQQAVGTLNVPLLQDKLGARMAAYYESGSGWIDRPDQGLSDINDNEMLDVRTKVLWAPLDALQIVGTAIIHRNDAGAQNIVNLDPRSDSNFLVAVVPSGPTEIEDDYELYSLTGTYDFGPASLLSATSYMNMDKNFLGQSQFLPLSFGLFETNAAWLGNIEIFSQELRLTSTGDGRLQWTMGGFYKDSEVRQDRAVLSRINGGALRPTAGGPSLNGSQSWAAFGDASYGLTEKLRVGLGLRYFEDDRQSATGTFGVPLSAVPTFEGSFNQLTSRLYVSYAVSHDINVYASRAEGFRSGGFNTPGAGIPPTFDPETLTAYELGAKMSLLDGRVVTELAVYYNQFNDMQFLGLPGGASTGVGSFTGNVAEAEMKGVDLSVNWRVLDSLTLGLSGGVIDTEVVDVAGTTGGPQVVGDPMDFVADYSLSVSADYTFNWADNLPGYLRMAYNQKGPSMHTARNGGFLNPQDEASILNLLGAQIGAKFGEVTVEVFGRNLLNEDGVVSPSLSNWHGQPMPRTFGLRAVAEF